MKPESVSNHKKLAYLAFLGFLAFLRSFAYH